MNHRVLCETRRRVARDACASIGDRGRIADRLEAATPDIDHALDDELGTLAGPFHAR